MQQFYLQITPCLPFLRKRSPDGATTTDVADIQFQLTTHLSTRKDERLSWPGWLTYRDGLKEKGKEEYLYSVFLAKVVHSKRSGMDHTVLPANNTMPAFPS